MRIIHLTVVRQLTAGQAKQLTYEWEASPQLDGITWHTLAYHKGHLSQPFMHAIPRPFRCLFMRKLYGWIVALRLSRQYDIVLMRHQGFDPFTFVFAPLIPNRISVHHAKEIYELRLIRKGWKGWAASLVERLSGKVCARHALAIAGVTEEIAEYERVLHAPHKPIVVYPNGIDPYQVSLLEDLREEQSVGAAFVCGAFADWHGLDRLIAAVDGHVSCREETTLTIHLIGHLNDQQIQGITATEQRRKIFRSYGVLDEESYRPILAKCDIGFTSLALDRKGLSEASSLKVREMLAMGLAVYSGHSDIALPPEEAFVHIQPSVAIDDIIAFARRTKGLSRSMIRSKSLHLIGKLTIMRNVCSEICNVLSSKGPADSVPGSLESAQR